MPRNGYQVADVSVEDTAALYDVWEALAPMTGQLAAGRVEEPAMRSLRRLATEPTAAGPDELLDMLEQLFDGVLRASGNPRRARKRGRVGRRGQVGGRHSLNFATDPQRPIPRSSPGILA
jgi:DNA-binding GntR family transcriptional regulator